MGPALPNFGKEASEWEAKVGGMASYVVTTLGGVSQELICFEPRVKDGGRLGGMPRQS